MALQYVGNASRQTVTLGSAYTAGSGTMSLTTGDGAKLPATGDFWIATRTGTYQAFKVTARSGDTLTVVGSADGTTDASLLIGQELCWVLSVSALNALKFSQGVPTTRQTPSAASFTGSNTGSSSIADDDLGLLINWEVNKGQVQLYEIAAPGSTYSVTARLSGWDSSTYGRFGISVRDSGTGKCYTLGSKAASSSGRFPITLLTWTTPSTTGTIIDITAKQCLGAYPQWFRITVTATNYEFYISYDGTSWYLIYTVAIGSSYIGSVADKVGVYNYNTSAGSISRLKVAYFDAS